MNKIIIASLMASLLAACATAPSPKQPDERHRVPINEVVPPELTRGTE